MNCKLYICGHCKGSEKVIDFVKKNEINVEMIDVEHAQEYIDGTLSLFVIPALIVNEKITAYGTDIIDYFKNKSI